MRSFRRGRQPHNPFSSSLLMRVSYYSSGLVGARAVILAWKLSRSTECFFDIICLMGSYLSLFSSYSLFKFSRDSFSSTANDCLR